MRVLVRRAVGIARVLAHLTRGAALMLAVMPRASEAERLAIIKRWSAGVLDIFGLTLRVEGQPLRGAHDDGHRPLLIVGNHISWIDIYAFLSIADVRFVAKSEVASWPLIGWFAGKLGTIFVERDRPRDALRVTAELRDSLAAGRTVCLFPEGTTTDGSVVLPFSSVLISAAIEAGAAVQPVSIAYKTEDGSPCRRVAFTGDATLVASMWTLVGGERSVVVLKLLPPIPPVGLGRRELARRAEDAVRASLGHAPRHPAAALTETSDKA